MNATLIRTTIVSLTLIACKGNSLPLETLQHNGEDREYFLHVPESHNSESNMPLVFNFHGFGGTSQSQLEWADFRTLADANDFIVVYPQGTELEGTTHWNSGLPGDDNKSTADDFGFIEALIDDLSENYGVDSERIYATGYSNGGFMSYSLACYHSERFAAIAPVSSTMLNGLDGDCAPTRPMPVLATNGTADSVVPYNGGTEGYQAIEDVLEYWAMHNNTSSNPVVTDLSDDIEHSVYPDGDVGVTVEHYRVDGGDHVWFSEDFGGEDLNTRIWDFLSQYDLNGRRE